jgi:uncharacterized protein
MQSKHLKYLFSVILFLGPVLTTGCGNDEKVQTERAGRTLSYTASVAFLASGGDEITRIDAAVASTPQERSLGLMDVRTMPRDAGMLFIFDREEPLSFWMANTPLPLDLIFVNRDMRIVRIHHNAQPFSERQFPSGAPALYVVEVNAGFCVDHDITEGQYIAIEL